jgi:hypothetical protein
MSRFADMLIENYGHGSVCVTVFPADGEPVPGAPEGVTRSSIYEWVPTVQDAVDLVTAAGWAVPSGVETRVGRQRRYPVTREATR